MSPQAQRIAIAEACGWKDEIVKAFHGLPDYLNDLNAMHEATHSLKKDQLRWYRNRLIELTGTFEAIDATAPQRAEAFLRTIGKWEEEAQS
jgi:hypothetical protein